MYYQQTKSCTANVTVNRNRLKSYGDVNYLKDGQHFEIELFNPTDQMQLAKISLNGQSISSSGIVLRPGERVFLERFIDVDRKFLFETYEVENSNESKQAIKNNGLLKVDFFAQYTPTTNTYWYSGIGTIAIGGSNNFALSNPTTSTNYSTINGSVSSMSLTSGAINTSFSNTSGVGSIETGRIEKGAVSEQTFQNHYGSFNSYTSASVQIKLMPMSSKPVEKKEIRNYCTGCGTRMKKSSWKFCPSCGTKVD